jgi:two-component system NtrC family sensor kinase
VGNPIPPEKAAGPTPVRDEHFRVLADLAPIMIWLSGPEKRYTFVNRAWRRFTGWTYDGDPGGEWAKAVHPDDLKASRETFQEAFEKREPFRMEYRLRRREGDYRWVLDKGSPRFSPDGAFAGFIGFCIDISAHKSLEKRLQDLNLSLEQRVFERTESLLKINTALKKEIAERKKIEQELHTSREALEKQHRELNRVFLQVEVAKKEWESTMDCIKDTMVVLMDAQGRVRRCNSAFTEMTARPYTDLMGRDVQEVLRGCGLHCGESFSSGEEIQQKPNGRWFVLNTYALTASGASEGTVLVAHDYTKLKLLTQQLEESNRQLETKSEELEKANAELKSTQVKILQQEKMATIGQLAAGVAHEINNPIGFVSSNLRTLEKYLGKYGLFIEAQKEALEEAGATEALERLVRKHQELKLDFVAEDIGDLIRESLGGADRVKKIVQDLKTFSRVDEAESKFVDLAECIESTVNIVWNELKYKAALIRDYGDLPLVKCYPQQLNQVILNLLVNAGHAIEKEGRISLKTWRDEKMVYFSVTDNGCGIPRENLTRLFEPFFTTKEVGKGTGLGLSIAYDIVKRHQGEIAVASELGQGTSFTVSLPLTGSAEET